MEFKEVETYIEYEELSFSREKVEEGNTLVLENSGVFNWKNKNVFHSFSFSDNMK